MGKQLNREVSDADALYAVLGGRTGTTLAELTTQRALWKDRIQTLLDFCLTDDEVLVIQLRYGLTDGHCYTRDEVARILNRKPDDIRRVESKAVQRLKQSAGVARPPLRIYPGDERDIA